MHHDYVSILQNLVLIGEKKENSGYVLSDPEKSSRTQKMSLLRSGGQASSRQKISKPNERLHQACSSVVMFLQAAP